MKLDQNTLDNILEAVKPQLIEGLKNELKDGITWQVKQEIANQVKEHVQKWCQENVLPEITGMLIESKEGLISVAAKLGENIVVAMVESLTETVKHNLETSWKRKKIFEALIE